MAKLVELFCGITCGLLGPLPFFCKHGADTFELFEGAPGLLLDAVLLFFLPGLLVAVGSYFHVVKNKTSGLILLLVGGIFLTVMMLVHFFGGVFYLFGIGGGVVILLQGLLALITIISVLVTIPKQKIRPAEQ